MSAKMMCESIWRVCRREDVRFPGLAILGLLFFLLVAGKGGVTLIFSKLVFVLGL
jgi:hypothetical protein